MAGSWNHIVDDKGRLLGNGERHRPKSNVRDPWGHVAPGLRGEWGGSPFTDMIENLGDAYEAIEECYGMVQYLANGDAEKIERARLHYQEGVALGRETESEDA